MHITQIQLKNAFEFLIFFINSTKISVYRKQLETLKNQQFSLFDNQRISKKEQNNHLVTQNRVKVFAPRWSDVVHCAKTVQVSDALSRPL